MGCYRTLIYDSFRRYNQKTSPVEKCASRNSFSSTCDPRRSGISQPILRKSDLQNMVNNNQRKSPNFVAKRFYSADVNKVPMGYRHWYQNPRSLVTLGLLGGAVMIPVYYWNSETVPYSKRGQFVVMSTSLEKKTGELLFKLYKSFAYKGKILASHHPESIRVEKIAHDIIGGLRKNEHLEELKWEIIVVDEPATVNARCLPGGKIVVYTGLLNYLRTDAEIATAIGHEVGHAVARHSAERMCGFLWLAILICFFSKAESDILVRLPRPLANYLRETAFIFLVSCCFVIAVCFTWQEREADFIGLLISASAGYDPRIAPEMYEKLENHSRSASVYSSTDPNGKMRAQRLSEPKVMEEALAIYREALNDKEKEKDK